MGKWIWGLLGLALIAAILYFVGVAPVGELIDLAEDGGERVLRDPMRPLRGGTRVLLFALDGVGDDELHAAVQSGAAPHIASLLGVSDSPGAGYQHAYAVRNALSILPSTTMAAWSSVYTGAPPAHTGVPGNEWFERGHMEFYAPAPVSVTSHKHTIKMLSDGLVGDAIQVPTLFELAGVRSFVSLAPVYRGADLFTMPEPSALADLFAAVAKGVTEDQSVEWETYSAIDFTSVDHLLEAMDKYGVPDLQVVYFPGIDLFTHVASAPLLAEVRYLSTVTDSAIGRVLARYDSLGVLDETYVVFVSDHGHTPVLADDRHSLGAEGDDEPPWLIAQNGFRLRPFVLNPEEKDYQAAVAYQGAMAYIYLADRSTCPDPGDRCDWTRPPRLEEDVMPLVRAFYSVSRTGEPIPALRGTLDLVLARGQGSGPFKVFDGERLVPIRDYLALHPRPDLLRFKKRMRGLAVGPYGDRAGNILLLSRSGALRELDDRFYFSLPYQSWHGSPERQDSEIPLVIARSSMSSGAIQSLVEPFMSQMPSQLDVVPLILGLLNRNAPSVPPGEAASNAGR